MRCTSSTLGLIGNTSLFVTAILLLFGDVPSKRLAAAPGSGFRCANTPAPFWTMSECRCIVPTVTSDFCNGRMPQDGTEVLEFRYCTEDAGYACDANQLPCGDTVYNCTGGAECDSEPSSTPITWGCHATGKPPEYCTSKSYTWCDPVQY